MPDAPQHDKSFGEGEVSPWELAGLGLQFGLALVAGVYAGQWLDRRIGSEPFGLIAGAFLVGGGVFIGSYRRLMKKSRRGSSLKIGEDRDDEGTHE